MVKIIVLSTSVGFVGASSAMYHFVPHDAQRLNAYHVIAQVKIECPCGLIMRCFIYKNAMSVVLIHRSEIEANLLPRCSCLQTQDLNHLLGTIVARPGRASPNSTVVAYFAPMACTVKSLLNLKYHSVLLDKVNCQIICGKHKTLEELCLLAKSAPKSAVRCPSLPRCGFGSIHSRSPPCWQSLSYWTQTPKWGK